MAGHEHASSISDGIAETWQRTLQISAAFDRPWVEAAVDWLVRDSQPSIVVDVGCGAGGAACAFAARLQPGSHVVAFDRDPRLVATARRRGDGEDLGDRISWVVADVGRPPVEARSVDMAWASGVVHHIPDQQAAIRDLARLVRPGGRVALVEGGLPMRCLPHEIGVGRPGLEARLDEARARWFADLRAELGGPSLAYGWPEALARAGLSGVRSRSFLAERTPPLDDIGWALVYQHLRSALDELGDRLDPDDRAVVARLLDPENTLYVGKRNDLMVTAVRTVHTGTRQPPSS